MDCPRTFSDRPIFSPSATVRTSGSIVDDVFSQHYRCRPIIIRIRGCATEVIPLIRRVLSRSTRAQTVGVETLPRCAAPCVLRMPVPASNEKGGRCSSEEEHRVNTPEDAGSIPVVGTKRCSSFWESNGSSLRGKLVRIQSSLWDGGDALQVRILPRNARDQYGVSGSACRAGNGNATLGSPRQGQHCSKGGAGEE